jgi:hypothetical protein
MRESSDQPPRADRLVISVAVLATLAIIAVYLYAAIRFHWTPSNDPADWGPFGDFLGGVLNPMVAFAALILLYKTYSFQRTELFETKRHFQKEARKSEIHQVIAQIDQNIRVMLSATVESNAVKNVKGQPLSVGVLEDLIRRGWNPPQDNYIHRPESDLETPIKYYLKQIGAQLVILEEYLKQYSAVAETEAMTVYMCGKYVMVAANCRKLADLSEETAEFFKSNSGVSSETRVPRTEC